MHIKIWPLVIVLIIIPHNSLASNTKSLTFSEALKKAEQNFRDLKKTQNNFKQAENDRKVLDFKDDSRFTAQAYISPKYTSEAAIISEVASVQTTKTLYDFGRVEIEKQKSDLQIKEKQLEINEAHEQLKWAVAKAYIKVLFAESLLVTTKEQLTNAQLKQQQTLDKYKKGLHPEYDLARANADFGKSNLTYKKAKNDYEVSIGQLYTLIYSSNDIEKKETNNISFKGKINKPVADWKKIINSWQNLLPSAASITRNANKEVIKTDLLSIKAKLKPQITLAGLFSLANNTKLFGFNSNSLQPTLSAQLGISWDIPWNGQTKYDELSVLLKIDSYNILDEIEKENREDTLKETKFIIEKNMEEISSIKEQRDLIEKVMELIRKRYDSGNASASDLSSIESEFISMRLDEVRSNNNLANSVLDLAQTMGVTSLETIFE